MLLIHLNFRNWPKSMEQTKTASKKIPPLLDYHLWKNSSFCILCGLCVRYCAEVKKKNAVGFVECGARREIRFVPELAVNECINCKECFELCLTSYLQAAFVLTESLYPR